jgi:hypothetical protein
MRKLALLGTLVLAVLAVAVPASWAGNPHFVSVSAVRDGNSLIVSGKEAGLGNEDQIHVVVTATAECINGGGKHPKAANKEAVSSEGDFPVQNGKAEFELTLTPVIMPPCDPPMTLRFTDVSVTDTTSGITKKIPGTF